MDPIEPGAVVKIAIKQVVVSSGPRNLDGVRSKSLISLIVLILLSTVIAKFSSKLKIELPNRL